MPPSRRYRQPHFRDAAAILAAERAGYGATPALNRITAAFTALFLADSRSAGSRPPYVFDPVLFREVALGKQAVNARPPQRRTRTPRTPRHYHSATGQENTPCHCPSPGTYARKRTPAAADQIIEQIRKDES